jgi:hypothetical protein
LRRNDRSRARETRAIRGHEIGFEFHAKRIALVHAPHPLRRISDRILQPAHRACEPCGIAARLRAQHRRRHHGSGERIRAFMQRAQEDVSAHRMGKRDGRFLRHRPHDLFEKCRKVFVIFGEIADMRLQWIGKQACRTALTAPVECCNGEAAAPQLADHFFIFFEKFRLPVEQHADAARF